MDFKLGELPRRAGRLGGGAPVTDHQLIDYPLDPLAPWRALVI